MMVGVLVIGFFVVCIAVGVGRAIRTPTPIRSNKRISQVGTQTSGGLACPNCGSTSFKAKRSAGGKVAGGLLAPKTRVQCEACGAQFHRG